MSVFDVNESVIIDEDFLIDNGFFKWGKRTWKCLFLVMDESLNLTPSDIIYDIKNHQLITKDTTYNIDDGNELLFILDKLTKPNIIELFDSDF